MKLGMAILLAPLFFPGVALAERREGRTAVPEICGASLKDIFDVHIRAYKDAGFKVLKAARKGDKAWLVVSYRNSMVGYAHNIGFRGSPGSHGCFYFTGYVVDKQPDNFSPDDRWRFNEEAYKRDKQAGEVIEKELRKIPKH